MHRPGIASGHVPTSSCRMVYLPLAGRFGLAASWASRISAWLIGAWDVEVAGASLASPVSAAWVAAVVCFEFSSVVPVLVLTKHGRDNAREECIQAGVGPPRHPVTYLERRYQYLASQSLGRRASPGWNGAVGRGPIWRSNSRPNRTGFVRCANVLHFRRDDSEGV